MLTVGDKQLVTLALNRLGPARVERGMRAFVEAARTVNSWESCFLARVFGEQGEFASVQRQLPRSRITFACGVAFGLHEDLTGALIGAFDDDRPEFQALCEEWLETNRQGVGATTVSPAAPSPQPLARSCVST